MKINWKNKLSSRKLWGMIAGFVGGILVLFNFPESEVVQITGLIVAGGTIVAYIFGESYIDGKREESHMVKENYNVNENLK